VIETAARMIDPASILLVAGGSLFAALLRSTSRDLVGAVRSLHPLFRARPEHDERAARIGVRQVEQIAEVKGTSCADHVETDSAFVRRAALKLADADSAEAFSAWAEEELEGRKGRHAAAAGFWRSAADAAPNMGMIGTVLGLIGMFASMDDPAGMGPAMALAMLTTFYGLVLGTLVFGPAAGRLERLSEAELGWQKKVLDRLGALARAEADRGAEWFRMAQEAEE
jgi:chemotaxis protein MotA